MRRAADPVTTVVIVPARNEELRIADCLGALAAQSVDGTAVVLVANNCDDRTVHIARELANTAGLRLAVLECALNSGEGVGTARRLGCEHALALWPEAAYLLSTDADCLVAPDWIARNRFHLAQIPAVCGRVEPMAGELSVLSDIEILPAEMEGRYERLVVEFYRHFRPDPCGLDGDHGGAAGASLAVHASAYRAVGGFADLATGEDRDLVRRLKTGGFGVLHAGDVCVAASCRLDGRAGGGMSDALRARAERRDYLIDDALPPAQALIDAATNGNLGPWPLQIAAQERLRARDLATHIACLENALRAVRLRQGSGVC
jgi:glycosyltransferase involved in cell wall biosynthesis